MPIYEYRCRSCGKDFELLVFGKEEPQCPECGAKDPERKMSSFGFSVGYKFKASSGGGTGSCSGCTSSNCSTCH